MMLILSNLREPLTWIFFFLTHKLEGQYHFSKSTCTYIKVIARLDAKDNSTDAVQSGVLHGIEFSATCFKQLGHHEIDLAHRWTESCQQVSDHNCTWDTSVSWVLHALSLVLALC